MSIEIVSQEDVEIEEMDLCPDPDPQELARATDEGMVGVPLPVPGEADESHDRERAGLRRILDARRVTSKAFLQFSEADKKAKGLKKKWEASVEDLDAIIADVESDQEPLPLEKGGILRDPAKEAINAQFGKPMTIPPTPPDDFAEALRRRQRDTPLASMGLKPSTLKALEELGLTSALTLVDKFNEEAKYNRRPTTLKGITTNRFSEIAEALDAITDAAESEWAVEHPAERGGDE